MRALPPGRKLRKLESPGVLATDQTPPQPKWGRGREAHFPPPETGVTARFAGRQVCFVSVRTGSWFKLSRNLTARHRGKHGIL